MTETIDEEQDAADDAAARDDARGRTRLGWYRHPSDIARFVFWMLVLGALVLVSETGTSGVRSFTIDVLDLVDGMPAAIVDGLVGLVQFVAAIAPVVAVIALVRRRKWSLMLLMVLAATIAAVAMALLANVVEESVPLADLGYERANSWFIGSQYPSSTYLAGLTAVLVTAGPWMKRAWRWTGWVFIVLVMLARILSATEVPVRNLLMISVGAAAGSLALVLVGAPRRRVDIASVTVALERAGGSIERVEPLADRHALPTFQVTTSDSGRFFAKVVGRDQRDSDLLIRTWRSLRVKGLGDTAPVGAPRRTIEREALSLGIFGTAVRVPQPVAVVGTTDEAAVLATTWAEGRPLADLGGDDVSDDALDDLWSQVLALQRRRLAHRALTPENLMLTGDEITFVDLRRADLDPSDEVLAADVAVALASLACVVGIDRTVESARLSVPSELLTDAIPLMQTTVLPAETRDRYKDDSEPLDELRNRVAEVAGVERVELAPVQRITVAGVVSLVGSLVLLFYVFTLAAQWDDIWNSFTEADLTYVIPIVFLMVSTYFTGAMSLTGAVNINLPYLRTVAVMFGQSFLNRFTPANAGGMAMRIRYLQLNGLDTAVSAAAIGLTSAASGVAQGLMIVLFLIWGGASDRFSDFEFPDVGTIVLIIVGVGIVVALVLMSTWGRTVVRPWVQKGLTKIREEWGEIIRNPRKLSQLFGGAVLGKLANIVNFYLAALAFGVDISFPKAGALYMIATTIGSAVPTPGGVGGVEAALTAALIGYGVDNATAAALVLFFRILTFWLPTAPGYFFMRYTQAKGIV